MREKKHKCVKVISLYIVNRYNGAVKYSVHCSTPVTERQKIMEII